MKQQLLSMLLMLSILLTGCTEETGTLGLYLESDEVSNSSAVYNIVSSSISNTDVKANCTKTYIGSVVDPETDQTITAGFAAQFHSFENTKFPAGAVCDSIEIRLFVKTVYGDKDNPMKISAYPLSKEVFLDENDPVNSDLFAKYVPAGTDPVVTKVFTATDYIMSQAQRDTTTYTRNVRLVLDKSEGQKIIDAYYAHPEYFADSYQFIHNVCPGFFFKTVSGLGTLLRIEVSNINLFFSYYKSSDPTTKVNAMTRFSATPEVIQSTQFNNVLTSIEKLLDDIKDENYTMVKSPAAICTELTLPVNEIYRGHENDTIAKASLVLQRINNADTDYALPIPSTMMLIRKSYYQTFFDNKEVADNQRAITTDYTSTYNTYEYSNIGRLLAYCWLSKQKGMKDQNLTEAAWEAANPDWNKVILIPVTVSTTTDSYGNKKQVSVTQDLSVNSTKLVRGTAANPIQLQVIYSRFNEK